MSNPYELRDADEARQFLVQSLWCQRILPVRAEQVPAILEWALAIVAEGDALPPLGFLADVGHLIFRPRIAIAETVPVPAWPTALMRTYEDYVLGKLLADSAFERAGDALRQYRSGDRIKGVAFIVKQMRERAGFPGVSLSPSTIKHLSEIEAADILTQGWESLEQAGPMPLLVTMYEQLTDAIRNTAAVFGPEDIFELEHRTAIVQFGQRVAVRQVLQAAKMLEDALPRQKPRSSGRRFEVPTRLLEEDTYPVGGFTSISTRGSIESLLHSQLAFMEEHDRPDLFDIKFLRDELLYYSRDENSFLRRRRTFVFALYPDLLAARFKDAELPYQRIIFLLAFLRTAVHKLIEWLSTESLVFEFFLIEPKDGAGLAAEQELLAVLLAEPIANGTVMIETLAADKLTERCMARSRRSLCQCLLASVKEQTLAVDGVLISRLVIDAAVPSLGIAGEPVIRPDAESTWATILQRLLSTWI